MNSQNNWSDWLDFNDENIQNLPSSPGVFVMHAAMKILYIDGSDNIKTSIIQCESNPCIVNSKRFRFMITSAFEITKIELIKEYQQKHNGNLPQCMKLA